MTRRGRGRQTAKAGRRAAASVSPLARFFDLTCLDLAVASLSSLDPPRRLHLRGALHPGSTRRSQSHDKTKRRWSLPSLPILESTSRSGSGRKPTPRSTQTQTQTQTQTHLRLTCFTYTHSLAWPSWPQPLQRPLHHTTPAAMVPRIPRNVTTP